MIHVTINDSSESNAQGTPVTIGKKKPYETPSFRFERVFEVSALSCGKISATQSGCHSNPKRS
jgi:hypothetical protein